MRVEKAKAYTEQAQSPSEILEKTELAEGIDEFRVQAPLIARAAVARQFVRVFLNPDGEFIPITLRLFMVTENFLGKKQPKRQRIFTIKF